MVLLLAISKTTCSFSFKTLPRTVTRTNNNNSRPWQSSILPTTVRYASSSSSSSPDDSGSTTTTSVKPTTNIDKNTIYDVIVVGGGHAGCDAAAAAARVGAKTALVTQRLDTIGELSCNPSVGGIGKGHLVREIDALDGLIGKVADQAGIHYRVLNRRKGPAVRGPRAQMDRDLYKQAMQSTLSNYNGLDLIEGSVQDLLLEEKNIQLVDDDSTSNNAAKIQGVQIETSDGTTHELLSKTVVITTGTFLRGVLMLGQERYSGGRHLRDSEQVEPPSVGLAKTLERFQFPLGRLKTGTPPRLALDTIDFDVLPKQPTELPATPFSHLFQYRQEQPTQLELGNIITCYQTATNEATHKLCMDYEHTLPRYDGGLDGSGNGPRYCPSIYKKVQRFPERDQHNCFLEPEGFAGPSSKIVYPNGMSGPYPEDVQLKIMRSMKGLGAVEIIRPGYDVEYDFVNPQGSLFHTLETKKISGLYLAGQICGTTGYEEAAAQGIVAGANAGRKAILPEKNAEPFILGRDEGYVGVLIDDLVTRGTTEPYRMFTSRAEYRISLRADNADLRLTRKGYEYGLVTDEERMDAVAAREKFVAERVQFFHDFELNVKEWSDYDKKMGGDLVANKAKAGHKKTAKEVLAMPHVTLQDVEGAILAYQEKQQQQKENEEKTEEEALALANDEVDDDDDEASETTTIPPIIIEPSLPFVYDTIEASIKYESYIQRQARDMESWKKAQGYRIPPNVQYTREAFPALSSEEIEKLRTSRPTTFAEASGISGITPQSLVYLYHQVVVKKNRDTHRQKKQAQIQQQRQEYELAKQKQKLQKQE